MSATPISWLALEGIKDDAGAALASGMLFFSVPGTSTQTPVYGDAAKTAILTQPVVADGYGRAAVFTDGPVRIIPFTSAGVALTPIDNFNAQKASEIVVEQTAFTGLKADGSTGAGGKVSLSAAMARALESFGGPDFKYLAASLGTNRAIRDVIRERGLSVKDVGAKGDGLTTDTAAFLLGRSLLQSFGGGVLLVPPGTYLIDAEISWSFGGLHIVGYGQDISIIKQLSTSATALKFTGSGSFAMEDVAVIAPNRSTGSGIDIVGTRSRLRGCGFSGFQNGIKFGGAGAGLTISDATITVPYDAGTHPAANGILMTGTASGGHVRDSLITGDGAGSRGIAIDTGATRTHIAENRFEDLNKGVVIAAGTTGIEHGIYFNSFSNNGYPIHISATAAIRARHFGNALGSAATIVDLSALPTLGSATELFLQGHEAYLISGATRIDSIGIQPVGTQVLLIFLSNPVVSDNVTTSAFSKPIQLTGAFTASANDTLKLIFDGTDWIEESRSVI